MLEIILLAIFSAALLACILTEKSILLALIFGLMIFSFYAAEQGHAIKKIFGMWKEGVRPIKPILITLMLIGIVTAYWRAAGVIPAIIFYTADFFSPAIILPVTFWLCSLISVLTGTAFGTAATMGIICGSIAENLGVPIWLTGGAILSGCYFGDRCSPMSTSALLVATLTGTDIFKNIVGMIKTSLIPLILASALYLAAGIFFVGEGAANVDAKEIFARVFVISPSVLIPAILIIVLSLFRLKVQLMMCASILACVAVSILIQGLSFSELLKIALTGYYPNDTELAEIMSGGGIFSMANVIAIVCLSSCYAGIFQATGFLNRLQNLLIDFGKKFSSFASVLVAAIITSMIACNQTLAIMLTHQLCKKVEQRPEIFAIQIENSAVVISPMIPWSIASVIVLMPISAPKISILAAWYLWLIPICNLISQKKIPPKKSEELKSFRI
ncbi:MAG: hypothetical protein IJQ85_06625 [Selenomonadaceae bacterium]|nr:hypothetical protein [Selenomonadaceae bacterium]